MIVRWGLGELDPLLGELVIRRPLQLASRRWERLVRDDVPTWRELPSDRIDDIAELARSSDADGLLAIGGGSAIDTAKAVSSATSLPLISVPTTYSGAEWTAFFGIRDPDRKIRGGGGGAQLAAIVYEPELTLELPRAETVGTAMNALAHCAEALYVQGHDEEAARHALAGAGLISAELPAVVDAPGDRGHRTQLLRGACEGGQALAGAGLALGHAMAQALGGRYGLPHGALNAICLPAALRFNRDVAADALARLGEAMGTDDPAGRAEELARLGGFGRLGDLGVPRAELREVAEATAARAGAQANPRPATKAEIAELLLAVW